MSGRNGGGGEWLKIAIHTNMPKSGDSTEWPAAFELKTVNLTIVHPFESMYML